MNLTRSLAHFRGFQARRPSERPVTKKAPFPCLTWKQLNQLLGGRMGVLSRTADPTGEVPGTGKENW